MANDSKQIYNEIRNIKRQIWEAEKEVTELEGYVKMADGVMEREGKRADMEDLKKECEDNLAKKQAEIEPLKMQVLELETRLPQKADPVAPKFDPAQHPILKKTMEDAQPAKPVVFNTGDLIEAKWEDGLWYKAKINMIMGSSSNPKYNVRFIDYDDATLTVNRDDVRPFVAESKKRKAEAPPATQPNPVKEARTNAAVISAPPTVNPEAAKDAGKIQEEPAKARRKIGGEKGLERKKNNWQNFVKKGPGKKTQKESMFRSGTTVSSKVGFTGSGAGMSETRKRVRPTYDKDDE
ncbi:hypothetical protein BDV96DRAFT_650814 [Lophiotrema nucula]|uniref:Tudor domain-containing protein n=1 Tax=Lophiotrema nucula TaxID=690887 RepID=A0A6A5YU37_9PLEO|nr:hypothetical protein BDV96DRAFT_650814 [Lophiotrema nucula]